jgi:hypothetical protein
VTIVVGCNLTHRRPAERWAALPSAIAPGPVGYRRPCRLDLTIRYSGPRKPPCQDTFARKRDGGRSGELLIPRVNGVERSPSWDETRDSRNSSRLPNGRARKTRRKPAVSVPADGLAWASTSRRTTSSRSVTSIAGMTLPGRLFGNLFHLRCSLDGAGTKPLRPGFDSAASAVYRSRSCRARRDKEVRASCSAFCGIANCM